MDELHRTDWVGECYTGENDADHEFADAGTGAAGGDSVHAEA